MTPLQRLRKAMQGPMPPDEAVRNLAAAIQHCNEVLEVEDSAHGVLTPSSKQDTPKVSKRKSTGELKAWMEKQREQCEVVENTQALVATDAKARQSYAEAGVSAECAEDRVA